MVAVNVFGAKYRFNVKIFYMFRPVQAAVGACFLICLHAFANKKARRKKISSGAPYCYCRDVA